MMRNKSYGIITYIFCNCKIPNGEKYLNYSTLVRLPLDQVQQNTLTPQIYTKRLASQNVVTKKLQELLNGLKVQVNDISKHKNFTKISADEIEQNYYLCLNSGLTKEVFEIYPNILADRTLSFKLESLKLLPLDISITAPLLLINHRTLNNFVFNELVEKRISEFAKLFQVCDNEVCKWMSKKPFLTSVNLSNVKMCTNILVDSGVTQTSIINDLWVLRYSVSTIEERIAWAKENNIDNIKTWMIRAQREIFDNYVRRRSDNKEILGEKNSLIEYLSEKLKCSQDVSKFIISKQPALQKKSLRKMNEMIDFLLQKGFNPIHICKTPKILLHSVETIKKRLKEIEATNMQLDSLVILTKSQRQYMHFLGSLKSNKSKSNN